MNGWFVLCSVDGGGLMGYLCLVGSVCQDARLTENHQSSEFVHQNKVGLLQLSHSNSERAQRKLAQGVSLHRWGCCALQPQGE